MRTGWKTILSHAPTQKSFNSCKPLLKWPGGKRSELPIIAPRIPKHERYLEPFFGGGSVYFKLIHTKSCHANDIHPDLMMFYALVKEQNSDFFKLLYEWIDRWEASSIDEKSMMYYSVRDRYNSESGVSNLRAVDFFFLREPAYGGMFRVNRKGEFNVPFGKGYGKASNLLRSKVDHLRSEAVITKMSALNLHCIDFEDFFNRVGARGGARLHLCRPAV